MLGTAPHLLSAPYLRCCNDGTFHFWHIVNLAISDYKHYVIDGPFAGTIVGSCSKFSSLLNDWFKVSLDE